MKNIKLFLCELDELYSSPLNFKMMGFQSQII